MGCVRGADEGWGGRGGILFTRRGVATRMAAAFAEGACGICGVLPG
jgi:hypothetical protein